MPLSSDLADIIGPGSKLALGHIEGREDDDYEALYPRTLRGIRLLDHSGKNCSVSAYFQNLSM